jgi:hypothetical protein
MTQLRHQIEQKFPFDPNQPHNIYAAYIVNMGLMLDAFNVDAMADEDVKNLDVEQFTFLSKYMMAQADKMNAIKGNPVVSFAGDPRYACDFTEREAA